MPKILLQRDRIDLADLQALVFDLGIAGVQVAADRERHCDRGAVQNEIPQAQVADDEDRSDRNSPNPARPSALVL